MMLAAAALGPTNVAVDLVQDLLVVGVGVDGGHQRMADAKGVVEHLDQRRYAVGGTGGVGHDGVLRWIVLVLVDAHDDGEVVTLGRSGDDHLLGPAL